MSLLLASKTPKIKALLNTDSLFLLLTSVLSCVPFCVFLPASYLSPKSYSTYIWFYFKPC